MDFDQSNTQLPLTRPMFDDFRKLRVDEHDQRNYDTSVGVYVIKTHDNGTVTASLTSSTGSFLLVTEKLNTFPIVCCERHAVEAAEYFCYGNMLALMPSVPNPKSPWAQHG